MLPEEFILVVAAATAFFVFVFCGCVFAKLSTRVPWRIYSFEIKSISTCVCVCARAHVRESEREQVLSCLNSIS